MSFISYAQNFEDVMLWRALKHIERGFYVDIGANDPVHDSVSKAFYDRGWRGVHVEPVAEFAQLLREARPDEEVIEKAVGAETGVLTLHVLPGSGLSSLLEESARGSSALLGYEHIDIKVPVITLDQLLAPYAGHDIHWLKIDVEGAELDVVRGWNTKRDRPWIMVVEATVPNTPEECHQAWEPVLLEADYQFVYFDGLSRFYVAKEHGDLAESFRKPPNVFDDFHRADLVAAIAERDENARQCGEVRTRLEESTAKLDAARQQLATAEKVSLERHFQLEKAGTDMMQVVAESIRLRAMSTQLSADNGRLTEQLVQLRSEFQSLTSDLTSTTEECKHARAEIVMLTKQLDYARAELRDRDSAIRSVTDARQAEVAALTAQLDDARADLRDRHSAIRSVTDAKQAEIAALTAQLDAMLNSTSWRLTAPLRGLRRIVSRN